MVFRPMDCAQPSSRSMRWGRFRLPHFEFVDCCRGNVVAAHEPRLVRVPVVCFRFGQSRSAAIR